MSIHLVTLIMLFTHINYTRNIFFTCVCCISFTWQNVSTFLVLLYAVFPAHICTLGSK
jgi:hypothetical protein